MILLNDAELKTLRKNGLMAMATRQNEDFARQWEAACRKLLGERLYIKSREYCVDMKINQICERILGRGLDAAEHTIYDTQDLIVILLAEHKTASELMKPILAKAITKIRAAMEMLSAE